MTYTARTQCIKNCLRNFDGWKRLLVGAVLLLFVGCTAKDKASSAVDSASKYVSQVGQDATELTAKTGSALGLLPPPPVDYVKLAFEQAPQPESLQVTVAEGEEQTLGQALAIQLADKEGFHTDGSLQRYLGLVAAGLVAYSDRPEQPVRVLLSRSERPFAFGLPGGYLLLSLGALRMMESESELAGLLGKGLAHQIYGHPWQLWEQVRTQFGHTTQPSQLAELDERNFALLVETTAQKIKDPGYTPEQHRQADRYATDLLTRLGYEPGGLKIFYARERLYYGREKGQDAVDRIRSLQARETEISVRLSELSAPSVGRNLSDRYRRSCLALLPAPLRW